MLSESFALKERPPINRIYQYNLAKHHIPHIIQQYDEILFCIRFGQRFTCEYMCTYYDGAPYTVKVEARSLTLAIKLSSV